MFAPAFAAIRAANDGSVPEEKLRAAFAECWRVAFDAVADKYGFTAAMRAAGWQVFRQTEVTEPMFGYGDLAVLKDLPVQRFLVTSGFRRLQESKVRALGFADCFAGRFDDAPYLGEYDRATTPWHMAVGEVDGEPVLIVQRRDDENRWTPRAAVRLSATGGRIERIADYTFCPWILPAASSVVIR